MELNYFKIGHVAICSISGSNNNTLTNEERCFYLPFKNDSIWQIYIKDQIATSYRFTIPSNSNEVCYNGPTISANEFIPRVTFIVLSK